MNMMTQLTQVMAMFGAVWAPVSTRTWHGKVQLLTITDWTVETFQSGFEVF